MVIKLVFIMLIYLFLGVALFQFLRMLSSNLDFVGKIKKLFKSKD